LLLKGTKRASHIKLIYFEKIIYTVSFHLAHK
jgi:hypothetical protein